MFMMLAASLAAPGPIHLSETDLDAMSPQELGTLLLGEAVGATVVEKSGIIETYPDGQSRFTMLGLPTPFGGSYCVRPVYTVMTSTRHRYEDKRPVLRSVTTQQAIRKDSDCRTAAPRQFTFVQPGQSPMEVRRYVDLLGHWLANAAKGELKAPVTCTSCEGDPRDALAALDVGQLGHLGLKGTPENRTLVYAFYEDGPPSLYGKATWRLTVPVTTRRGTSVMHPREMILEKDPYR